MLILVYVIQVIYGGWSGYVSAQGGELEHTTVPLLLYLACIIAFFGGVFGEFYHFFVAFLLWFAVAFTTQEIVRLLDYASGD